MSNKKEHDTQELYIKEINWPEIKRRTKIAFKAGFVSLFILFAIAIFLPKHQDQVEGIYIYI